MMQNFTLVSVEQKETASGKPFLRVNLFGDDKKAYERVAIWSTFPNFHTLMKGSTVMGEVEDKGKGLTLNPTGGYARKPSGGSSPAVIGLAQERKAEMIRDAQGHKDVGIKLAGCMRDAALIVTNFYPEYANMPSPQRENEILAAIERWRDMLMRAWDEGRTLTGSDTAF